MPDRDGYAEQEGHEPVIPDKYKDDFTDFEPLTLEPEEKETLAGLRKLSDENGFEYGQAKTDEGFSKVFTSSISNAVEVPEKFLDGRSVELFHAVWHGFQAAHPSGRKANDCDRLERRCFFGSCW